MISKYIHIHIRISYLYLESQRHDKHVFEETSFHFE